MFAAASGARLAHRHNKAVKKQSSANQLEGHVKPGLQRQQQIKNVDLHGFRYAGIPSQAHSQPPQLLLPPPQRRLAYSSKLYSSNYNPGFKFSTSYIDINGRISKLGQFDFEGKAAWQDRELSQELDRRKSICIPSEVHNSSKFKQKEAHRRWVRKNRIQDLSLDDHNSDEDDILYGVQNGAANLLLYVGLGTMCVGMIIAFVGTGEKGFKTMELRLIGPSLIGVGILIIILRILLCVCPSKCLHFKKHKHKLKNSANKLNSEGRDRSSQSLGPSRETSQPYGDSLGPAGIPKTTSKQSFADGKKRVSIAMLPTTSGLSTNPQCSSSGSRAARTPGPAPGRDAESSGPGETHVPVVAFYENEKPTSSRSWGQRSSAFLASPPGTGTRGDQDGAGPFDPDPGTEFELKDLTHGRDFDVGSLDSGDSIPGPFAPDTLVTPDTSDVSITSVVNAFPVTTSTETETVTRKTSASKFESVRSPKNLATTELVLTPSSLRKSPTEPE